MKLDGFAEFLKEKGYDPEKFEMGCALEDIKKGHYGNLQLTSLAAQLLLEFLLREDTGIKGGLNGS